MMAVTAVARRFPTRRRAETPAGGRHVRVLEDRCPPFTGYHLYCPSRRQPSAALTPLMETLRFRDAHS
jgi:DNA-binding transcriptional LysR family regulator